MHAFEFCGKLTDVTVGSNVTFIGNQVFYQCKALSNIKYNGTAQLWDGNMIRETGWDEDAGVYTVKCTDTK